MSFTAEIPEEESKLRGIYASAGPSTPKEETLEAYESVLTGIPELDYRIILNVPDTSLTSFCATSQYVNQLCRDEYHWQQRVIERFGIFTIWADLSWMQYYYLLYNNSSIAEELGLTQEHRQVQAITSAGYVAIGSEAYQSLALLIPKAIRTENSSLIEYFLALAQNSGIFFPYEEAMTAAVEVRNFDLVKRIFDLYDEQDIDPEHRDISLELLVSRLLGKEQLEDVFEDIILPRLVTEEERASAEDAFSEILTYSAILKTCNIDVLKGIPLKDRVKHIDYAKCSPRDIIEFFSAPVIPKSRDVLFTLLMESVLKGRYDLVALFISPANEFSLTSLSWPDLSRIAVAAFDAGYKDIATYLLKYIATHGVISEEVFTIDDVEMNPVINFFESSPSPKALEGADYHSLLVSAYATLESEGVTD